MMSLTNSEPASATLAEGVVAVLFAADGPLEIGDLVAALAVTRREVEKALDELRQSPPTGLMVQRHEDRVQLATAPAWAESVARLRAGPPVKLSRAALEVLAIVAYRQPTTRAEIDQLRGVNSDRALASLQAHGVVEEVGRRETVGRPSLFATTVQFLELIGARSLTDLPGLAELAGVEAPIAPSDADLNVDDPYADVIE